MIHLNTLFAKKEWLTPIKNQQTFKNNWRVMAKTCDGETYVYVRSGIDRDEVRREIAGVKGIEKIYDGAQAVKLGADPRCTFLVEAKAGWYFTDEAQRPAVIESVLPSMMGTSDRYRGVHGYGADKPDYFTTAVFYGPDIKKRAQVEHAELVDEGPTFAELLGLSYPRPTAGKPIKGIFKEVKHEI